MRIGELFWYRCALHVRPFGIHWQCAEEPEVLCGCGSLCESRSGLVVHTCMASNKRLECICNWVGIRSLDNARAWMFGLTMMHSRCAFGDSSARQISDCGASRSLSKV
jgi:hypothetical protein